ncbi:3'-5' exonuclease Snipper [Phlebotomus argentipes]|uniref:3'-5' exonuclease Snipper n=1 Tax=Phlebotomus argentipes TaxID=94469 RepID=UPI002892A91B|nr:3'-5' exonuclease Snipper [Phlebotomus argentipes]XP_059621183.1 3'-5' exonuclease Snipper [Phlebotomus argentipes]
MTELVTEGFTHVLVIDFEATCWEGKFTHTCEIIEFPAVLYNLETQRIEKEFRQYVRPTETPELSEFCTRFTGITQQQVRDGVILAKCLLMFNNWVKETVQERGLLFPRMDRRNMHGNVALMTWSNWDMTKCLKQECVRKSLSRASYFNQWIDLKKCYEECFNYPPRSFADALDFARLKFEGRQHCGMDDARNIAKLAGLMHRRGYRFELTANLLPPNKMNFPF